MQTSTIKTSIVVLNWNGKHFLKDCLESLKLTLAENREILVVDNGSTDGSIELVNEQYPFVRLIKNSHNLGFSKAVNIGIRESKGKYVALLNNDIIVLPGWIDELESELDKHPKVGFCASRMILYSQPDTLDCAGNGFSQFMTYSIGYIRPDGPEHDQTRRVFGACAGAAIYRKELFEKVGYFDEDFFINTEDNDLSLRANLYGFHCHYVSAAKVLHHHSGTLGTFTYLTVFYYLRNTMSIVVKDIPLRYIIRNFPKLFSTIFSLFLTYTIAGRSNYCTKAIVSFLYQLPTMTMKRIKIQNEINVPMNEIQDILNNTYK